MSNTHVRHARSVFCGALGLFALSAILIGCNQTPEKSGGKGDASKADSVVDVVKPKRTSLPRMVEQPGTIQAYEETQLYARVPGYVRLQHDAEGRILYDIGRVIRGPKYDKAGKEMEPGEVLAEITVPELADEVKQRKALIRQAEAEVDQARKSLASAEANISTMEAAVVEAKALFERWDSESKRIAMLVKNGVIDAQARDETQNQFKASGARVSSTEAAVRKAKADRDKSAADVKAAEAKVDVTKAEADRSETMLGYAKIRAPYDGIVIAKRVNTGDFVQPTGAKGEWLFTVARLDPVRMVISVPEVDAGRIQLDKAEVNLNVPALIGQKLPGPFKLTRTSWALDPGARTLRTEIDIPNKDGRLRPGMYVYAKISNPSPECWTLPASAVVKQGDAMNCYQIDEQGKVTRKTLQVGRSDGTLIEVLRCQKNDSPSQWEDFSGNGTYAIRPTGLTDGQMVQIKRLEK
jgi:multidrug efflux pump subunit AcrA (membrane-fusion protein)